VKRGFYVNYGKRIFDLGVAGIALVLFSPLMLITAVLIRVKLGKPVLFRQQRPGKEARPFFMIKFRSMTDARNKDGNLLSDAERLTPFGCFLRSASLDELPELLNVLRGDMSLVGPRPLVMSYLQRYNSHQMRRHEALPGITGWAQVNGRNTISWEQRFDYDVWYVDHCSLPLDLKVLCLTMLKVINRADINEAGQATQSEFMGTPPDSTPEMGQVP
jgi:lipopolysaccharide/colanic/teichoic acid biosynthesis glycosyltransferase